MTEGVMKMNYKNLVHKGNMVQLEFDSEMEAEMVYEIMKNGKESKDKPTPQELINKNMSRCPTCG